MNKKVEMPKESMDGKVKGLFESARVKRTTEYCINHPRTSAIARCAECGLPFCNICIDRVGDQYICYACLKKKIDRAKNAEKKGAVTFKILMATSLFFLLAIMAFIQAVPNLQQAILSFLSYKFNAFYTKHTVEFWNIIIEFSKALMFFFLGYETLMMKRSIFLTGMVVSLVQFFWSLTVLLPLPSTASNFPTTLIQVVSSFLVFICIYYSKDELV